ncbi:Hypothetical predicted protein [Olea europaea subsp. europaea]|uniref:protein disulfide-isomerase n=1 Tax=Olea europaea subsp. europaea TaxID=158383 RepID=A0A8S0QET2_OLEEU|nr:Hypothetical predicted protein [Olea europaea subsp. europaea]
MSSKALVFVPELEVEWPQRPDAPPSPARSTEHCYSCGLCKKLTPELGHTFDAKLLPRVDSSVAGPIIMLFKPFDEHSVDFQDFDVDALLKSVESSAAAVPSGKHLTSLGFDWQAMSFLNFGSEHDDSFRSKYLDVAKQFKCKGLSFLMGDFRASQGGFQFFGLKEEQVPLIITQANNRKKYLKRNVEPDQIAAWFKDFTVKNPSSLLIGPSLHLSMEVSPRH